MCVMGREADERLGKVPGGGDWWQVEGAGAPRDMSPGSLS